MSDSIRESENFSAGGRNVFGRKNCLSKNWIELEISVLGVSHPKTGKVVAYSYH